MKSYQKMLLKGSRWAAGLLSGVLMIASNPIQAADVTVSGINFSNNNGKAMFIMFSKENKDGFPDQAEKSACGRKPMINNLQTKITCKDINPGTYAAVIIHDENGNGKVDTNFFGYPNEDFGISNNPCRLTGRSFESAEFQVGKEDVEIIIELD